MHNNKAATQAQNTKDLKYNFKIFKWDNIFLKCDNISRQKVIWGRRRHALKTKAQHAILADFLGGRGPGPYGFLLSKYQLWVEDT